MSNELELDDVREAIANGDAEPISHVLVYDRQDYDRPFGPAARPAVWTLDGPRYGRRSLPLAEQLEDHDVPDGARGVFVIIPAAGAPLDLAERCRAAAVAAVLRVLAEQ